MQRALQCDGVRPFLFVVRQNGHPRLSLLLWHQSLQPQQLLIHLDLTLQLHLMMSSSWVLELLVRHLPQPLEMLEEEFY